MNFIKHFNQWMDRVASDERLTPHHVSLYLALFHYWNLHRFRNPVSIAREEMMLLSRIGSANTYTKCIKELHQWGYLGYEPSFNPLKGSRVYLYSFEKGADKGDGKASDKAPDTAGDTGSDTAESKADEQQTIKVVRPSINYINKTNNVNERNRENSQEPAQPSNSIAHMNESNFAPAQEESDAGSSKKVPLETGAKEKVAPKRKEPAADSEGNTFQPPKLEAVKEFFQSQQFPQLEGEKFFHYYQSKGWKVGNAPMQDWQAAAHNWMLHLKQFPNANYQPNTSSNPTPGRLHTTTGKDYSEPL